MPYQRKPPKKWPARDAVRKLAGQHTVEALEKIIKLMDSDSEYVRLNAARTVLLQSQPGSLRSQRMGRSQPGMRKVGGVNVQIAQFKEENKSGSDK